MAQITLTINGKAYIVGCEDGQETHLRALGAIVGAKVDEIGAGAAGLGDTRLMLMAALVLADELASTRAQVVSATAAVERLNSEIDRADGRAIAALEAAARKIEAMASR